MRKTLILFVEDDASLMASIAFILEREGFAVRCAPTGQAALTEAAAERPDLVLLDVNLPDMDGFQVCQRLRRNAATASVPVIMVTARTSVDDVVLGLEQFADDYVTKPFHPRVLVARINATLRRGAPASTPRPTTLRFASLEVDETARVVSVDGEPIALTKSEFDLLLLLAQNANRVLSREAILDHLHADTEVTERTVDFQVFGLRKKLGPAALHLETVRGVGYKFNA
jgi:two-component system phosphate regulon response regulator PhoB